MVEPRPLSLYPPHSPIYTGRTKNSAKYYAARARTSYNHCGSPSPSPSPPFPSLPSPSFAPFLRPFLPPSRLPSLPLCPSVCLPICLSVSWVCMFLSVCLPAYLYISIYLSAVLRFRSGRPLQADGGNKRAGARRVPRDSGQPHLPNRRHGGDREPLRGAGRIVRNLLCSMIC